MAKQKEPKQKPPVTLSEHQVRVIHDALVRDFAISEDPISPPGEREPGLLASAVSRQSTSLGQTMKYPDALSNASTLMYGICNDHVFRNGNKRTALVAMLAHMDLNNLVLADTNKEHLFDLMLEVASHRIGLAPSNFDPERRRDPDEEIAAIVAWLRPRTRPIDRAERFITYRDLRRILARHHLILDDPKGNRITIYREPPKGSQPQKNGGKRERIGTIGWPGESRQMDITEIRHIRALCKLTAHDGCDSRSFYDYELVIDSYLNNYRTILVRLAKV